MYIYAFFRICCRMSMHRQLRIRTLFSGGAHSDADTVVFSTFGKPLTASDLYIIARTKAFFCLTEEPFLCCGKGSSACRDVLSGSRYVLFREAEEAFPHLSGQTSWLPMLLYALFIHVFPPSRFCFADFFCQNKVKPELHKYAFCRAVLHL